MLSRQTNITFQTLFTISTDQPDKPGERNEPVSVCHYSFSAEVARFLGIACMGVQKAAMRSSELRGNSPTFE